jgi:hypothetical protein
MRSQSQKAYVILKECFVGAEEICIHKTASTFDQEILLYCNQKGIS